MADDPEPPEPRPAPRRRAARKVAGAPAQRKPHAPNRTPEPTDDAADAASAPVPVAAEKAVKAVKPRSTSRATPRVQPKPVKAAPEGRAAAAVRKSGGAWGVAAIAGGLGAAATLALLSLRGSTPKKGSIPMTDKAHQPDGTDSSASFAAGIADEGTIPGDSVVFAPAARTGGAHQPDGTDSTASFEAGIADEGTIPG